MEQYNLIFWLVFLLAAVMISYFVLPGIAPIVLVTAGVVILALTVWKHWSTFGRMEYERATWQYNLRQYGSYVLMAFVLLGAYGYYVVNGNDVGSSEPTAFSTMTGGGGAGFGMVMKTASSRIQELMRRGRITLNN